MFDWLARLIIRHPWWVLVLGALMAVGGAIAGAAWVRLDADTDHLISPHRPFMQRYEAFKERFGDLERIWVVVDSGDDPAAARTVIDWMEPKLAALELPQVVARVDVAEQARLISWSASADQLAALVDACSLLGGSERTALDVMAAIAADLQQVTNVVGPDEATRQRIAIGAIAAVQLIVGDDLPTADRYITSPSGRLHFIGILPGKDYGTLAVIEEPLAAVRNVLKQARAQFPDIDIGLTGKPVLQADEMRTSNADMTRAALIAMVLVTALVIALLGQWKRPLLAVLAFAMAVGWTWGFVALAMGRLTLLSIVFLLVMIGVGLDFGVHVVSRHWSLRTALGRDDAIRTVMQTIGRANLVAALTSVAVFLSALATDFGGLQELGIIAAVGIGFSVVAMSTVLPALLVVFDRYLGSGHQALPSVRSGRRPRLVLLIALVTAGVSAIFASQLRFETNLLALQAADLPASAWERRIAEDAGAPTWFAAMEAEDQAHVARLIQRAQAEPAIGRVRSVLDVVSEPDAARARARAALVECVPAQVVTGGPDAVKRAVRALSAVAAAARSRQPEEADDLDVLAAAISGMTADEVAVGVAHAQMVMASAKEGAAMTLREVLPESIRNDSIAPDGTLLVMAHPAEDVWDEAAMTRFVEAIRRVDKNVTGVPITHLESIGDMRRGFGTMTVVAAGLVLLLLLIESRGWREPLICVLALSIGAAWTLGLAEVVGLHLNLANFFAVPVLFGLGVDGAVHMIHRARHGESDGSTRRAVLLTGLTTMVGFGSLLLAAHRGLASLGGLMAIGCLACLVASLMVVPAALQWLSRRC
ncbi:MAG: MMPL family transporter [Phycisphaerales bacterium]|nr:MMPL family transporter [Phycisphaerales bacterium]